MTFATTFMKYTLSLSCILVITVSVYPWSGNYEERNIDILNQLRGQLQIDITSETIPLTFQLERNEEFIVRNLQGIPFSAKIKKEDPEDFRSQFDYLFDERKLSAKLEGICSVLPLEYWNYEWCHRREFSQFHLEQEPKRIVKAPDWSLGKYARTIVVRGRGEVGNPDVPIVKLVDYYTGGQICHENNQLRSVEVHIQCCDGTGIPNAIPSEAYQSLDKASAPFPLAILNRISEPELCTYQATVCSPLLCMKIPDDSSSPSNGPTSSPISKFQSSSPSAPTGAPNVPQSHPRFTEIMKILNSTCLARQEEWWTYELCFNKGVRQVRFNLEQTVTAEGTVIQKQVLANQYSLGEPPFALYEDEAALIASTKDKIASTASSTDVAAKDLSSKEQEMVNTFGLVSPLFKMRARQPNFLSLEFVNGTACDLEDVNRSVIVEMYCGLMNTIVQIREDSTCKYRIKVELGALCTLPGFAPVKENVTTITFTPLYNPEEEGVSLPLVLEEVIEEAADVLASTESNTEKEVISSSSDGGNGPAVAEVLQAMMDMHYIDDLDKYIDDMEQYLLRTPLPQDAKDPSPSEVVDIEEENDSVLGDPGLQDSGIAESSTQVENVESFVSDPLPETETETEIELGDVEGEIEAQAEASEGDDSESQGVVEMIADFALDDDSDGERDSEDYYVADDLEDETFADKLMEQLESILDEIENAEVIETVTDIIIDDEQGDLVADYDHNESGEGQEDEEDNKLISREEKQAREEI